VVNFSLLYNIRISSPRSLCKHPHSLGWHLEHICSISMYIGLDVAVIAFGVKRRMRVLAQPATTRNTSKQRPIYIGLDLAYRIEGKPKLLEQSILF